MPPLLSLVSGNQNNNNAAAGERGKNSSSMHPVTGTVYEQAVKADSSGLQGSPPDNQKKNAVASRGSITTNAIPGTVALHEEVLEAYYPRLRGDGPLLLVLILANLNNNNAAASNSGAGGDAIPGTVVVHEEVVEARYPELLGGAPLLPGLLLVNQNGNNPATGNPGAGDGAIPSTHVMHEQVVEADCPRAQQSPSEGILLLRGESPPPKALTQSQLDFYNQNGYLVLPDTVIPSQTAHLLYEAHEVMKRISARGEGTIHHNTSGGAPVPSPVCRVIATFESKQPTRDPLSSQTRPIARLGCGIHARLHTYHHLTHSSHNRAIAESLNYSNPLITQSQVITKAAGVSGEIIPHQDGCVSFTNPASGMTFCYALEDASVDNGCLSVAAGSHRTDPLRQRLVKSEKGVPRFEALDVPVWARGMSGTSADGDGEGAQGEEKRQKEYTYTPLEVEKGTLILFHGNLLHTSGRNTSEKSRMAYMFSIIDGVCACPEDSYLMPVGGGFERL